ncbi:VanZ family protein [Hymenobacter sp. BT188]|uniref:VanZ family protein n=1 Tax=Hymenobacter sp. BT188 TaxID=2763504 RepID=UPI00165172E0|nr:VanZ family protein [Hymenobacter sp. BT188]MBC6608751.1 VanZ family protein [Hymenobacter sp. BT188]
MRLLQIVLSLGYSLLLGYIVFFARRRRFITDRTVNFTPLRNSYDEYTNFNVSFTIASYHFYANLVGNVLLFVPVPFVLCWLFKIKRSATLIYCCLGLSVFIEAIQYAGKLGVADIDDVILNTSGAAIAILYLRKAGKRSAIQVTRK